MRFVEKVIELLGSILKKKLLLLIVIGSIIVVLIVFLGLNIFRKTFTTKPEKGASVMTEALTISVSEGAYSRSKSFEIRKISSSNLPLQLASTFVSDVYEVTPVDKIEEFAMKPILIRYRLPANLYLGEDYANVRLAYIPNTSEPIYRTFGGAYIDMDEVGPYIETEAFHTSTIGLIANVPQKQKLGLQLIKENSKSAEPVLLLIPDIDRNFLGFIPSTLKQDINIWSELFPSRTIMYYEYPIVDTKSKSYMNGFRQFSKNSDINSFLLYEAEKLSAELLRLKSLDFDILAHGMGGLIARLALERHPEIKNIRTVVLVSTPNKGTNIVNPIYFGTLLFGKPSELIATNFGTDKSTVDSMKSHLLSYLESIGPLYKEVSVSSKLLSLISSPRKDIKYLCVVGNKPPMSIDLKGTPLESFYPELVVGSGDGVVTKQSATIDGIELFESDGSFFDCYLSPKFHEKLKKILDYQPPKIPEYKVETYSEKVSGAKETETIPKPVQTLQVKAPSSFKIVQLMKKIKTLDQQAIDIFQVGSKILIQRSNGLYDLNGKVLYQGDLQFAHVVSGKLRFYSNKNAIIYDESGISQTSGVNLLENCVDLLVSDMGIFSVVKSKGLSLYKWEREWKKVTDLPGEYARFIDGDSPLVLTNEAVYSLSNDSSVLKKLVSSSEINIKGKSVDFTTCVKKDDLLILGLRSYSIVLFNLSTKSRVIVAEGWIDPIYIGQSERYLLISGSSSVLFFDSKNMVFREEIHKFDGKIKRIVPAGKEVYALVDRRIEIYELP